MESTFREATKSEVVASLRSSASATGDFSFLSGPIVRCFRTAWHNGRAKTIQAQRTRKMASCSSFSWDPRWYLCYPYCCKPAVARKLMIHYRQCFKVDEVAPSYGIETKKRRA